VKSLLTRLRGWRTIPSVSSDTSREGSPIHEDRDLHPGQLRKALACSLLELAKAARSWKLPDPCIPSLRWATQCRQTLTRSLLVSPLKRSAVSVTGSGQKCRPASTRAVEDIAAWLHGVRTYDFVGIDAVLPDGRQEEVTVMPRIAQQRIGFAVTAPTMPYVTTTDQALDGQLYAVNLHSGTFRIEDVTGHSIRIEVPESLRPRTAPLIGTRVRVIGKPNLDERHHLMSFEATDIGTGHGPPGIEQTGFFDPHKLVLKPPLSDDELDSWGVSDLAEDEVEAFLATLRE
jgi:hypothetical protein